MILDIARHKFYEGLITLLTTTIMLVVLLIVSVRDSGLGLAPESGAMSLISSATLGNGFMEGTIVVIIYVLSVLSLSRFTLRTRIYPTDTMAPLALCAVMILPMLVVGDALRQAVVVMLMTIALGNMFFCFGPRKCIHRLFAAMVAAGTLAVVDGSLVVVPVVMCWVLISARKKLREALATVVGMLLPLFTFCYVEWLLGGGFGDSAHEWWRGITANLSLNILDNLTITRMIFVAFIIFLQATSMVLNFAHRDLYSSVVRGAWRSMQLLFMALLCSMLLLPSAADSSLTALIVVGAASLTMYFVNCGLFVGVLSYMAIISLAIAAAL